MSHNTNKVNAQEPSRTGVITQSISDLSDVSVSAAAEADLVAWSGSAWSEAEPRANVVASARGIDTATGYFTTSYYNQTFEDSDGFYINLRVAFGTPSVLMTLENDATYATNLIKVFSGSSTRWKGFGLQPGHKFQLQADVVIPSNSTSGSSAKLQWRTSTGTVLGPIGYARRPDERLTRFHGFIDTTGAGGVTNVGLYNHGLSGNVGWIQAGIDNRQLICTARIIE